MASGSPDPSASDGGNEREARIDERIAERAVSLMVREFQRAPVPVMVADSFIAYLAAKEVGRGWPSVWLAIGVGLQLYRYWLSRSIVRREPRCASDTIRKLTHVFAAIGIARAAILPVFFAGAAPAGESAFLVTMVLTGLAAGGVASAAGFVRALVVWGGPNFSVLILGWSLKGGVTGYAVALLLLLLFAVLLAYVRDQRLMIEELVRLVDDREVLSASVQRERDKVELVSEAKTRFFAAASHDLRQPLHALSINATTLGVLAARLDHQMLRDVSRGIDSALSQSQSLLDGLLDISLLDAHAVEVRLRPLDLVPFLQEICDEFRAQANASGLQLVVEHHSPSSWCLSDPDQLRRIVHNLVSNSLKFTATGWITLRVDSNGSDVTLQVLDTGLGLPASECEKVFEEFYQFGNPSRDRAQGLGLGLAIVKRTCELLGIRLKFSSTLGVGTVVQLFIAPAEAEVTATPLELPTANEPAFHLSVLLIDDEIQVLQAMERYLTALAWTVRSCATGREAEAALEDGFVPDVLVADYRLRNESGLDVIARLHARIPGLPAVVVTGDTAPARLRELSSQVTAVLHKPIGGKVLVDALVAAVTHHAAVSR